MIGSRLYSGEPFNLLLVVVGHNFGVTTGAITANFISQNQHSQSKLEHYQYHQWLSNAQCSNITYTAITTKDICMLQTTTIIVNSHGDKPPLHYYIAILYNSHGGHGCLDPKLLATPVYINISILPGCPPGFSFHEHDGCTCLQVLNTNQFKCYIRNNAGYLEWNSTMWVSANNDAIIIPQYCPLGYCLSGKKVIDLGNNSDS